MATGPSQAKSASQSPARAVNHSLEDTVKVGDCIHSVTGAGKYKPYPGNSNKLCCILILLDACSH